MDEQDRVIVAPSSVIKDADPAGLQVVTWTFRSEPRRLVSFLKGDAAAEHMAFYALGVDGPFSGYPDVAVEGSLTSGKL